MNKFIWQSNNGQLDYLLIDDKTLSHYENPEQDQGVLARIIPTVRKGHKNYRVFIEENLTLFGETPWWSLNLGDMDEEEINDFSSGETSVKDFDSLREARAYVERHWDRMSSESPFSEKLEDQYSYQRLNLFHDYVRRKQWHEDHKEETEQWEKEYQKMESDQKNNSVLEHQRIDEFLNNLESGRSLDESLNWRSYHVNTPESIWKEYEEDVRRLGQSYDKYKKRINEMRYDE